MARKKRLTRKEKIAQSIQEQFQKEDEILIKTFTPIDPETLGFTDKKIVNKIIIHSEEDGWDEDFKHPKTYYINDALGNFIYFKTNDRMVAQEISDKMFGKGHYTVRKAMVAQVR